MAEVHLVRENASEMHFAHRPGLGLLFAALGAGFAWLFWARAGDAAGRWVGLVAGLVFAAAGVGAAFWRYELTACSVLSSSWGPRFSSGPRSVACR